MGEFATIRALLDSAATAAWNGNATQANRLVAQYVRAYNDYVRRKRRTTGPTAWEPINFPATRTWFWDVFIWQ